MRETLTKQFVVKTLRKIIIFTLVMIIVTSIGQALNPIISNELALTQMQNDNTMFVIMDTYDKVKPIITFIYAIVVIWFTSTIARDTYKFVKTINTEKEN